MRCPWCGEEGEPYQLWEHLQTTHGQAGCCPAPEDNVRCDWDGCEFEGTSNEVVEHFQRQHDEGQSGRSRNAPQSPELEDEPEGGGGEENQQYDATKKSMKVRCRVRGCKSKPMEAGRTLRRHAYGKHWHHPHYMFWCQFCGDWKRNDQKCASRSHLGKCLRHHLKDYGPPRSS